MPMILAQAEGSLGGYQRALCQLNEEFPQESVVVKIAWWWGAKCVCYLTVAVVCCLVLM